MATTIVFAVHFALLMEYPTAIMQLVGTFGSVSIFVIGGCKWYAIICIVGLFINSYAMSFVNPNGVRKSILISSPLVLAYDILVTSVGCAIYEAIVIISSIIGLIRFGKEKEKQ